MVEILLIGGILLMFAIELLIQRWQRNDPIQIRKNTAAGGTMGSVYFLILVVIAPLFLSYWFQILRFGGSITTNYLGCLLFGIGISTRVWAVIVLREYFSHYLRMKRDQKLITAGPYRYLRHPAYTGTLLISIGLFLILECLPGLFLTPILIVGLAMRASQEERMLLEAFGEEYEAFRRHRFFLVPFVY